MLFDFLRLVITATARLHRGAIQHRVAIQIFNLFNTLLAQPKYSKTITLSKIPFKALSGF
jgi:hypothetical protein